MVTIVWQIYDKPDVEISLLPLSTIEVTIMSCSWWTVDGCAKIRKGSI
jgi:hypothetical protein